MGGSRRPLPAKPSGCPGPGPCPEAEERIDTKDDPFSVCDSGHTTWLDRMAGFLSLAERLTSLYPSFCPCYLLSSFFSSCSRRS